MLKSSTTLENDKIDSLAIGGFDGVHIAHQKLLSYLSKNGAMLSIYKHGLGLTPSLYRCRFVECGCILIDLESIKSMSSSDFVEFLKEQFPNLKKIIVGYDFRFGRDREGDVNSLKRLFHGDVIVVDEVKIDGISVHSRYIKELLKNADLKLAKKLLGRDYKILGEVISGQGLGKEALYATINIKVDDFFIPKNGVYASYTYIDSKKYKSVTFIGKRLSTDKNFSIETHLIDKKIELKEKEIEIEFIEYIRENKKFNDLDSLKKQITSDIDRAKKLLEPL